MFEDLFGWVDRAPRWTDEHHEGLLSISTAYHEESFGFAVRCLSLHIALAI